MFRCVVIFSLLLSISLNAKSRFTVENGTVRDNLTGLLWQQKTGINKVSFKKAKLYCKSLKIGKINGWRVPKVDELMSLVDKNYSFPSINKKYFPNTISKHYWSSTINKNNSKKVWIVFFNYGYIHHYMIKGNKGSVRCIKK